ncbi:MAG: hypothetical protein JSS04_26125 [Proteobacteria bacterium]|nr:hypothetical protein [Pseudomonadota bacterium]
MRQKPPPSFALGRQLAEWRRPLDRDPAVDEAVVRLLHAVDRALKGEPRDRDRDADQEFSRAAAD